MALDPENIRVYGDGEIYIAAYGTTLPTTLAGALADAQQVPCGCFAGHRRPLQQRKRRRLSSFSPPEPPSRPAAGSCRNVPAPPAATSPAPGWTSLHP